MSSNGTELQFVTINGTGNIVQNDALYATSLNMINGNFDANGFDVVHPFCKVRQAQYLPAVPSPLQ